MDEIAFELCERREYSEHEATRGCRGIDVAREHLQADATLLKVADKANDVRQRTTDAVQLPNDESIAVARHLKRLVQARRLGCAT